MKLVLFFGLFISSFSFASTKVAVVKMMRGKVEALTLGKSAPLKVDDWVEEGAVVKTGEKSFAKLIFTDKSQMNVGPSSELKIEKFSDKEAGVIDVVKGKIRSQVTKDYLQMKDQDKSKLFIKTKNAVMGVRGTDFMITTNGQNTATVLFEGQVVFNHLPEQGSLSSAKLEEIVDRGVMIQPGEFSVVEVDRPQPTVPAVLNVEQRETLESNVTFETKAPSVQDSTPPTIVPEGLTGQSVSNTSETIKSEFSEVASIEAPKAEVSDDAKGFVDGDKVRPANGSLVHFESGTIIPPAADSVFDPNTNSFIASSSNGTVNSDGSFVPPANVEITTDGKILVVIPSGTNSEPKVVQIEKPAVTVQPAAVSLTQAVAIVTEVVTNSPAAEAPQSQAAAPKAAPQGQAATQSTARSPSSVPIPVISNSTLQQMATSPSSVSFNPTSPNPVQVPAPSAQFATFSTSSTFGTNVTNTVSGGMNQTNSVIEDTRTNGRLDISVIK
jgi:hypothetical protein